MSTKYLLLRMDQEFRIFSFDSLTLGPKTLSTFYSKTFLMLSLEESPTGL